MNNLKSKAGFTLVELIVVIAILAILAGVAVPAYSGYITKANEASDYTLLDSVKTAVVADVMEQNPQATVSTITFTAGDTDVAVTCTATAGTPPTSADISDFFAEDQLAFKSDSTGASWSATAGKWTLN